MAVTAKDIIEMVQGKETDQNLLRERFGVDFDHATLKPYVPERKGRQSYTSSAPKNFFDKVVDGLNRSEVQIRIQLADDSSKKKREAAAKGELFLYSAFNDVDRNLRNRGEPPLRETLAWYICLRGWYIPKCLVYNPTKTSPTIFDVDVWDPMHVTFEYGGQGLLWVAYKRQFTRAYIKSEYNVDIKQDDGIVIEYFNRTHYGVVIEEISAFAPRFHLRPHKREEMPVLVGSVGSMPTIFDKNFTPTLEHRGDSVFSASRGLFKPFNKQVSQLLDMSERSVAGSIVHTSKDGKKAITGGDPFRNYQEIKISSDEEESIKVLELPTAPPETAPLLGLMDTDKQQSMLPYPLAYGGTQQPLSGRALDRLADATQSVYSPRTSAEEQIYTWLSEQILAQYKKVGKSVTIRGFNRDGKFFNVKVDPKEIDEGWYVSVEVRPRIIRNMAEDIATAVQAVTPVGPANQPLLSLDTARRKIIQMLDPDAEADRIAVQTGLSLPPVQARLIVEAILEAGGDQQLADEIFALLVPQQQPGAGGGAPGGAGAGAGAPPITEEQGEAILQTIAQVGLPPELADGLATAIIEILLNPAGPGGPGAPPVGA